jgi:hypothetical protein
VSIHATSPELIGSPAGIALWGGFTIKAAIASATNNRKGKGVARFTGVLV